MAGDVHPAEGCGMGKRRGEKVDHRPGCLGEEGIRGRKATHHQRRSSPTEIVNHRLDRKKREGKPGEKGGELGKQKPRLKKAPKAAQPTEEGGRPTFFDICSPRARTRAKKGKEKKRKERRKEGTKSIHKGKGRT